ncbi:RagB/SusD family nutrient uptake outer membrane protein [Maribacter sp. 2210JD10-5]|uniref:RagB/SusD family nutrient uptake outer membrane protein n=1 Tax=Maribacter sp. 2210JD10-5 TaxID=3386272 RepID=UPI0039BC8B2C
MIRRIITLKKIHISVLAVIFFSACTNLEEIPLDQLDATEFNQDENQVGATIRGIAASFSDAYDWRYMFMMHEVSTDIGVIPTRNGGWNCCGERNYNEHTWDSGTEYSRRVYNFYSLIIGRANSALQSITDEERFQSQIAEIRFLRALAYFDLMDLYGNVPIVTEAVQDPNNLAGNQPIAEQRAIVFNFVEEELIAAIADLPEKFTVPDTHYPRPVKEAAQGFLAKLYLNAEVYSGTPRWNECIAACNDVISSGAYSLTPNISDSFVPQNQNSPEIMYASVKTNMSADQGNGLIANQLQLQGELAWKFNLPINGWGGFSVMQEHFETYDEDDYRRTLILQGPQFVDEAQTEPLYKGAGTGGNGDPANGQFEIFDIESIADAPVEQGFKSVKYVPDPNATGAFSNNDVVILRYADILLTKAEAILRGGSDPDGDTPESLVNMVRARNFDPEKPILNPTLGDILAERAWEFSLEAKRRQDLIRFGQFIPLDYKFKVNFDNFRTIYPIPLTELDKNPNLVQNPGY